MKRYNKDFKYTKEFIKECIYLCLNRRWRRTDVSYFFAEYIIKFGLNNGLSKHRVAKHIRHNFIAVDKTLLNGLIDRIAYDMLNDINNRRIEFKPIVYQERFDSGSNKVRKIGITTIKQQIFDYIAVKSCENMFLAKIGYYQCASLKGKGPLFGKQAIEKWIRKNPTKSRYYFKCDIKKCYPSVNRNRLLLLLKRDIKNKDILYVLETLIRTYDRGICIGSYLSQHLANYYLSYLYHYVSEKLVRTRKCRNGRMKTINIVTHVLFYMDDIIVFTSKKAYLKIIARKLERYAREFLMLRLKDNKLFGDVNSRFIDMMGYKIYAHKTTIRKRTFYRIRRLLFKARQCCNVMPIKLARQIACYYGYIKHTDSYKFRKKYKVDSIIKKVREVISVYDCRIYRETAFV